MTSRWWIKENLKIIDKRGNLIPLWPNIGQLMLHRVINRQRKAGFPVRIILLKPRQVGWSTWTEAEAFYEINQKPLRTALVVSADTDSTNLVFNITKLFQDEMPEGYRRETQASSRKEIVFTAPHRSKIITQTAGKDVLGRGGTVHFFHGSEVAMWQHAKEGLAAVLQMVPKSPDTTVVLESTAQGMGGAFYDMFWQAVDRQREGRGLDGYIPVFFPWFKFPEYSVRPPKGFQATEEEECLKRDYQLQNGQIHWRRLKIEELGGDVGYFKQEYPATALEAFITSGNPVFTQNIITSQARRCSKDIKRCLFSKKKVEYVNRFFDCWQVIEFPQEGREYAMGIDTMEGKLSDTDDTSSKLDYHGAAVLDRGNGHIVAIFKGRCDQGELAEQCLNTAYHYNEAFVAPEVPNGMVVLDRFRNAGYQNLYNRQIHDEQLVVEDSDNLGWKTTLVTRRWLADNLISALRDKSIQMNFPNVVDEMRTFIRDKTGKPVHMPGKHDDLLFAVMIALQIHLRVPLNARPYDFDRTGSPPELVPVKKTSLAYCGAIDEGIEDDEDEDYYLYHTV